MSDNTNEISPVGFGIGAFVAAIGGWLAYSAFGVDHHLPLPPAIDAPQERMTGVNSSFLSFYSDRSGSGRPLVLIHSINAAASSYEMKPIFESYCGKRPVYSLDLPGFGASERADRVYSPQLYKAAILEFLTQQVNEPADVVALSLGCEFAASAALEQPNLFHSLTLISPSGFTAREKKVASQKAGEGSASDAVYSAFSFPLWSQAFYDLLATKKSIHYFLQRSFVADVDSGLQNYSYATSHQPGARYAPLYFVSGKLFSPRIREEVYEHLTLPVLVIYDQDAFVRFDTLPAMIANHENWRGERITPTRGLPQFEQINTLVQALDRFWA